MIGAYGYLAYMLLTFDKYQQLVSSFQNLSISRWVLLIAAILLMPLNWILEALKWRRVVSDLQPLGFYDSVRGVLMGLASGFFTPNRVCDPVGRVLVLNEGNKIAGLPLSVVCTISQSFACCFFLLVAIIAFPFCALSGSVPVNILYYSAIPFIVFITLLYFTIPLWASHVKFSRYKTLDNLFKALREVSYFTLLRISLLSIMRYALYCFQYFLIIRFMGIQLGVVEALVLIPVNYFLISITPSVSFSEIGIRGTLASLLIGTATSNPVTAALAAVVIWVINYIIPLIAGSVFVARYK